MDVTRRQFLGSAASAVALMLPLELARGESRRQAASTDPAPDAERAAARHVVLDLGKDCALRESLEGYRSAAGAVDSVQALGSAPTFSRGALLVIPAALAISPSLVRSMTSALRQGATVILESGAVFAAADSREFDAHRTALRDLLRVHVGPPVSLWPRPAGAPGLPYVAYTWPAAARVRDFSRALPIESPAPADEIIATVDALPVALRRRVGPGTLLFLGSPLGPALRAGDTEARSWLESSGVGTRNQSD